MTHEEYEDLIDTLKIQTAMRDIEAGRVKLMSVAEALAEFEVEDENSPVHWPEIQHFH
jgi:hypothetical protein